MKNLKKISRTYLKKLHGGDFGPEPCGGSWSADAGPRCTCEKMGGIWACDKCVTDPRERVLLALANNCDQFNNWPG